MWLLLSLRVNCRGTVKYGKSFFPPPDSYAPRKLDWYWVGFSGGGFTEENTRLEIISIKREDNQPDTSGNPPPLPWEQLQGTNFANDCLIALDEGSIWTFAIREWGSYLSRWANQNEWMQQFSSFDYRVNASQFFRD